jgi:hypothetical protein
MGLSSIFPHNSKKYIVKYFAKKILLNTNIIFIRLYYFNYRENYFALIVFYLYSKNSSFLAREKRDSKIQKT